MQAFTSARYTVPLGHHSYPIDKYHLVPERLVAKGILAANEIVEPMPATVDDILRVHSPDYVRAFCEGSLERKAMLRLGLPWSPALVRRVFAVVGGTLSAARMALREGVAVNLAGGTHHAFADHGEGYCIFHDMVISLRRLRFEEVAQRFLIIDLDVHQGNGTAALCLSDPDVFTFSMHGANNYPAYKEHSSWDIGLPDETGDDAYLDLLAPALPQIVERFKPEVIFYQAGVDVLAGDRFGKLALTMHGVGERDRLVCTFARRAGLPLVVTFGGGYARDVDVIVDAHCQTVRIAKEG